MAILRFTVPQTGAFRRTESQKRRPFSVPAVRYLKAAIPINKIIPIIHQKDFKKWLTAIRTIVINGRVCFIWEKISVIRGTTNVINRKMTRGANNQHDQGIRQGGPDFIHERLLILR